MPLNHVNPGDLPRAADQNALVDEVNALSNIKGGGGIAVYKNGAGTVIALANNDKPFLGIIKTTGPAGTEADYVDERYWVQLARCSNTDADPTTALQLAVVDPQESAYGRIVTATNLGEVGSDSHGLADGDYVLVFMTVDQSSKATPRYYFSAGGGTESVGQYTFMVRSVVAHHSAGWCFLRANPML